MTPSNRLTTAGFVATAVAFGPARMGFGVFLPAFRNAFALSTTTAGLIASGGFLAFLVALLANAWFDRHEGERLRVVTGALLASAGFVAVAASWEAALLAVGIALAGASAGLCWAPFNDAAERVLPDAARPGALSVISTGTTVGVILAAGFAFAVTQTALDWRAAWAFFALGAIGLAAAARQGMPSSRQGATLARGGLAKRDGLARNLPAGLRGELGSSADRTAGVPGSGLLRRAAVPLYATAICFGMTNAVFLSFAADRVVAEGGLSGLQDGAASAVIFFGYGICGVLGFATGRIEARIGLAPLLCAIFAAGGLSLILIALMPTSWSAVLVASGLQGMALMMVSAVLSFWSLRLFPGRGTLGFTAALLGMAAGSVLGPALAGLLAGSQGGEVMFLAASVPPLATALWFAARLRLPLVADGQ